MDDSRRTSSSQGVKQDEDEKLDEDNAESGATSNKLPKDGGDLERGSEPVQSEPSEQNSGDAFLVGWDENDPANPRNWNPWYKTFITFQLGMLALAGSLGSSIISPAQASIAKEFDVSLEVSNKWLPIDYFDGT